MDHVCSVVVVMVYPINNMNDFNTDSTFLVIPSIGLLVLPFVFIWLGHKSSGELKVTSYIIVWGAALYLVGSLVVNAGFITFIDTTFNGSFDVYCYFVWMIAIVIGIVLIAYAATKFHV